MDITLRYPRVYRALKQLGFSPTKAVEILFDAERGIPHAFTFIRIAHRALRTRP